MFDNEDGIRILAIISDLQNPKSGFSCWVVIASLHCWWDLVTQEIIGSREL